MVGKKTLKIKNKEIILIISDFEFNYGYLSGSIYCYIRGAVKPYYAFREAFYRPDCKHPKRLFKKLIRKRYLEGGKK